MNIERELEERLAELREQGKLLEAQRLEQRTRYDLEMMQEMGFCSGIENYSGPLTFRERGATPYTLMDLFPGRYADHHRRVPCDAAANSRDVQRRPGAQGSARRARLPAAVGAWTTGRCASRNSRRR